MNINSYALIFLPKLTKQIKAHRQKSGDWA